MSSDRGRIVVAVRDNPYGVGALVLALVAGTLVFVIAHELFPYLSVNHDEGVYLQQAAMLLEGRLFLTPGSEGLREAFHPWFFVESPRGLYPKYAPVPAAVFALGTLVGDPRLALAAVAATNVGLGYLLAAAAFDRPTGLLAAAVFAGSPLFLLNSGTFLPYATTTALNLLFAVAYVRSVRRADRRYAALAGLAIGLAFFARPYTAVLFAAPFVVHVLWRAARACPTDRATLSRTAATAGVGLLFVAVTLGYNAVVTGSALRFPYQAFAPLDGVGFGPRAILGHEVVYTPGLALRANATVLWTFATEWFSAGPLGIAAAVVGIGYVGLRVRREGIRRTTPLDDRQLQLVLVGVLVTVVAGNVAFWGNLNILGRLPDPTDGLISALGPFYHFDLLLPLSAFAAHGTVESVRLARRRASARVSARTVRLGAVILLVIALPIVGTAHAAALDDPVSRNAATADKLAAAYAPFESTDLEGALVFLPPTYGEWRNHPFQWLRNEPGFDGPTVYALSLGSAGDFAVVDAYPDRALYRYRYHGVWSPEPDREVVPLLERLQPVEGETVTASTTVAVPERIIDLTVAVSAGESTRRYDYEGERPRELTVDWRVSHDDVTVEHPNLATSGAADRAPLPIDGPTELVLMVTITEPDGGTLTYREAVSVRPTDRGVQLLWPPASTACPLVTDCGLEGTYLPDRPDTRPSGIAMNSTLQEAAG